jgi:4-hydroxy-tetrahydrodipicolinate reductase
MIKLAISGACGKMGSRILNLALRDGGFHVVLALERPGHPEIGRQTSGVRISDDLGGIREADVLIEFTSPAATLEHLENALSYRRSMVIGTTGLSPKEQEKIRFASKEIPIVFSPNMSVGVNLVFRLVKTAAQILSRDYVVSITEAHHIHKKDAPSGTAKKLAQIVKEVSVKQVSDIKSIREDEIVGDHEVTFESGVDVIKISHSAKTRDIFAYGALFAAKWLVKKNPGLYSMTDVLGIEG